MELTVYRLTETPVLPTYGVFLKQSGAPFALTLERPWRDNLKGLSCIPRGRYAAVRHISPKFGETFLFLNVSNRSEILIHKGNIDDDSHGCILIGEQFNPVGGEDGITSSKEGFEEFMRITQGQQKIIVRVDGRYTV